MAKFAPSAETETRGLSPQAAAIRPRETVGDLLRRARQEQGGEIEAVAKALRIRAPYLAAIEQARYDRLPGVVYALGFVRTYANHLGLDGDEAVRRFKLEAAGLEQRSDLSFPMPLTKRSMPGGRVLLAAFTLAVCAYGIWHYLATGDRSRAERVAAVPADLLPPPPPAPPPQAAAAPAAGPPASDQAAADPAPSPTTNPALGAPPPTQLAAVPVAPVAATALAPPPVAAPAPPPASTTLPNGTALVVNAPASPPPPFAAVAPASALSPAPSAALADPAAAGPHVYGAVAGPSRITLRALKDCWIMVRDSDQVVAQRTLRAGDTYRVPDRGGLMLRTGNASGLEVLIDDKAAPKLGGTVREIALDATQLASGARTE